MGLRNRWLRGSPNAQRMRDVIKNKLVGINTHIDASLGIDPLGGNIIKEQIIKIFEELEKINEYAGKRKLFQLENVCAAFLQYLCEKTPTNFHHLNTCIQRIENPRLQRLFAVLLCLAITSAFIALSVISFGAVPGVALAVGVGIKLGIAIGAAVLAAAVPVSTAVYQARRQHSLFKTTADTLNIQETSQKALETLEGSEKVFSSVVQ